MPEFLKRSILKQSMAFRIYFGDGVGKTMTCTRGKGMHFQVISCPRDNFSFPGSLNMEKNSYFENNFVITLRSFCKGSVRVL